MKTFLVNLFTLALLGSCLHAQPQALWEGIASIVAPIPMEQASGSHYLGAMRSDRGNVVLNVSRRAWFNGEPLAFYAEKYSSMLTRTGFRILKPGQFSETLFEGKPVRTFTIEYQLGQGPRALRTLLTIYEHPKWEGELIFKKLYGFNSQWDSPRVQKLKEAYESFTIDTQRWKS